LYAKGIPCSCNIICCPTSTLSLCQDYLWVTPFVS
jgi:hypothetical protein